MSAIKKAGIFSLAGTSQILVKYHYLFFPHNNYNLWRWNVKYVQISIINTSSLLLCCNNNRTQANSLFLFLLEVGIQTTQPEEWAWHFHNQTSGQIETQWHILKLSWGTIVDSRACDIHVHFFQRKKSVVRSPMLQNP